MVVSLAGTLLWRNSQYALYLTSVSTFFFLIISYLALLNYKSRQGIAIRLLLLLPTLYLIVDLFYNLSYTSAVGQDLAVGFLGWWCLVQALDVGIISSLQGESPPRWCVPDWNKEESNRKDGSMPMNGSSKHSTLSLWTRTPITSRPAWAIKTNHIPLHWKLLPLPSRLSDQLVWILDVMLLRRPGTSPFWPQEMRALEWSQKRLVSAARVNKEAAKVNLAVTPFGYNETSLRDAILQMLLCICAGYCHGIHVTEARLEGFYNIDVYKQLIITFSVGILVAFPNDLVETIMFHILQQSPLHLPCTALTPLYRRVSTSKDLTTMWSSQWHQMYRKECIRMSKLLPFLQSSRAASVLKVFFFSAVMHGESGMV